MYIRLELIRILFLYCIFKLSIFIIFNILYYDVKKIKYIIIYDVFNFL